METNFKKDKMKMIIGFDQGDSELKVKDLSLWCHSDDPDYFYRGTNDSFDHCVIPTTEEEESADKRDSSSLRFPRNDTFFQLSSPHFAQKFWVETRNDTSKQLSLM